MVANRSLLDRRDRRGFGLIEMAITGALIATAMLVTVQVVGWIALERKAVERRERALVEAENLLERVVAVSWGELSTESLKRFQIGSTTAAFLRNPKLDLNVTTIEDAPVRKKVMLEIRWNDRSGRPEAPVRLVTWVYRRGEAGR